jgi:hypothetical protein
MASNRFGLKITRYLTVVLLVACRSSSEDSGDSSSTLCRAYEHVVNHACIPCAEGSINEAGEDPNGEDTSCEVCEAGSFDAGVVLEPMKMKMSALTANLILPQMKGRPNAI